VAMSLDGTNYGVTGADIPMPDVSASPRRLWIRCMELRGTRGTLLLPQVALESSISTTVPLGTGTDRGAGTDSGALTKVATFGVGTDRGIGYDLGALGSVISVPTSLGVGTDRGLGTDAGTLVPVIVMGTGIDSGAGTDSGALSLVGGLTGTWYIRGNSSDAIPAFYTSGPTGGPHSAEDFILSELYGSTTPYDIWARFGAGDWARLGTWTFGSVATQGFGASSLPIPAACSSVSFGVGTRRVVSRPVD
jgi:hypothetical protein